MAREIDGNWVKFVGNLSESVAAKFRAGKADFRELLNAIEDQPTLPQPSNEPPPCYQPDGDGCAYQCYDGDDEPIDKCKECPLCYSDKHRHRPSNEPLDRRPLEGEA